MKREELKETGKKAGLRSIAVLEALKGIAVLALGLGLLHYLHRDVGDAAERLLRHLHMNPARHYARVFLEAAYRLNDGNLWGMAAGAAAYSIVRFIEAYGLWNARVWAEWFALLSGCLYLPWEVVEVVKHATPIRWAVLLGNIAIVLYMAYLRWSEQEPAQHKNPAGAISRLAG